jgi:hypothetical protein
MAWFEDGALCTYFGTRAAPMLAVGWLECGRPYARGTIGEDAARILRAALELRMIVPGILFKGFHRCTLCTAFGGDAPSGYYNLYIPDGDRLWVAPELFVHYVEAHEYHPPNEFLRAVERALAMGIQRYGAACGRLWGVLTVYDSSYEHRITRGSDPPRVIPAGQRYVLAKTPTGDAYVLPENGCAELFGAHPSPCSVNGARIGKMPIHSGTVIQVGDETFRYEVIETKTPRYRDP